MIDRTDRTIRVFISFTFRDMQEEPDVMLKVVFQPLVYSSAVSSRNVGPG